jgi:hypothetical protein
VATYSAPSGYTAGRYVSINGKQYSPGDVVPAEEVAKVRSLNVLISSRRLVPVYDNPSRPVAQNATKRGPVYVVPKVREQQAVAAPEPEPEQPVRKRRAAKKTVSDEQPDAG